jgi:uncharacterized protein YfaS (alpha-2-macroglobulin family)
MSVEVQWTDVDPKTGERRIVEARRFARGWEFRTRAKRREDWMPVAEVTREIWEALLEALERRFQRREGVQLSDLQTVRKHLAQWDAREARKQTDQLGEIRTYDESQATSNEKPHESEES